MAFDQSDREKLLVDCKRRCCICYRFCGTKIEIHHIEQKAHGGTDDLNNAIPLCFDCHAEVKHYNPQHPKGTKFTDKELKMHRDNWLDICRNHPEALVNASRETDIGPLESLLFELEYNLTTITIREEGQLSMRICGHLKDKEYERAVSAGVFSLFTDDIKSKVLEGYKAVAKVNQSIDSYASVAPDGTAHNRAVDHTLNTIRVSQEPIGTAFNALKDFIQES